jgi:hypothetical protein
MSAYDAALRLWHVPDEPFDVTAFYECPHVIACGPRETFPLVATLSGEEFFLRGWLLRCLQKRLEMAWAVIIQALLFIILNLLVAFLLPSLQGVLYAIIYLDRASVLQPAEEANSPAVETLIVPR